MDKKDIADAVGRLREMNAALSDWDRIRAEGEIISREEAYQVLTAEIATLRAENERLRQREAELLAAGDRLESQLCDAARERDRLREAIRRLADQDATLSVRGGGVTVQMDATPDEDPMAYLAFATDGSESCAVYMTDGEAQAAAEAWGWQVMPLYLAPRLTDAERDAVEAILGDPDLVLGDAREPLRGLLERFSPIANCDATPGKCTVPPQCTEGGGK